MHPIRTERDAATEHRLRVFPTLSSLQTNWLCRPQQIPSMRGDVETMSIRPLRLMPFLFLLRDAILDMPPHRPHKHAYHASSPAKIT